MKNNRRITAVILLITISVIFFCRCMDSSSSGITEDLRGNAYAGSASCMGCHQNICESYSHTAHFNTSSAASNTTIKGSFVTGRNEFVYNAQLKIVLEKNGKQLLQSAYSNNVKTESHPFDIVIGSGRKAQTYLYYDSNKIRQLPISYFVPTKSWAISPGYPSDHIRFNRNIPSTCFGCHASYMQTKRVQTASLQLSGEFEKGKSVLRIDCERCHGPAAAHVNFHGEHPNEKKAAHITSIASLTRQQKTDMCAQCHSGLKASQKPIALFAPGDDLSNYYYPEFNHLNTADLDVHGNQYQLLAASKCYIKSSSLTCGSCHNPHAQERENIAVFSTRCINCHKQVDHSKVPAAMQQTIKTNCIDCHMPLQPSKLITLLTNGQKSPTADMIRTHLISVYDKPGQ